MLDTCMGYMLWDAGCMMQTAMNAAQQDITLSGI